MTTPAVAAAAAHPARTFATLLRRLQARMARQLEVDLLRYFQRVARRVVSRFRAENKQGEWITPEDEAELERLLVRYAETMIQQAAQLMGGLVGDTSPLPDYRVVSLLNQWHGRADAITATSRSILVEQLQTAALRGYSLYQTVQGVPADNYAGLRTALGGEYAGRAETIARTEMAYAAQGGAHERYQERGVRYVDILDGSGCGWLNHEDADKANGSRRTLGEAMAHPLSHPRCRRVSVPVLP